MLFRVTSCPSIVLTLRVVPGPPVPTNKVNPPDFPIVPAAPVP